MVAQGRANIERHLRNTMGAQLTAYVDDPEVIDIMLNPDGMLFVRREGQFSTRVGEIREQAAAALISSVAETLDRAPSSISKIISGPFPIGGCSFEGLLSPIVPSPVFCIRKKPTQLRGLTSYVDRGLLSQRFAEVLRTAVRDRKNIVIAGRACSGKTALANALLAQIAELAPSHRLAVVEEEPELLCPTDNAVYLRTCTSVNLSTLLESASRLRPDRVIVGEVRDRAAFDLIKSWRQGFSGGLTTIAAESCLSALARLEELVAEAVPGRMQEMIGQTIDLIIGVEKVGPVHRVSGILKIEAFRDGSYSTFDIGEQE